MLQCLFKFQFSLYILDNFSFNEMLYVLFRCEEKFQSYVFFFLINNGNLFLPFLGFLKIYHFFSFFK